MDDSRTTTNCCKPVEDQQPLVCCPGAKPAEPAIQSCSLDETWITGTVHTPIGDVPLVSTILNYADRYGSWKARWGIGRMKYRVEPGLYAVGTPTSDSPVLVTANYKMSFDRLRSQLNNIDAWIMVLDTQGINVWCAAGKGTFGTDEIVKRVQTERVNEVVSHKRLLVPQLGAPGVSAHQVKKQCGFSVVYGPVLAEDLPAFLEAGLKATPQMRSVRFSLPDRMVLIPCELTIWIKYVIFITAGFLLLAGVGPGWYSWERVISVGTFSAVLFLVAFVMSTAITPVLRPWLPGRSFSGKGVWVGLVLVLVLALYEWRHPGTFENWLSATGWFLMIPAMASFVAMNYTGTSTYTSLSGVRREMRVAVPLQIISAGLGVGLWLVGRFV